MAAAGEGDPDFLAAKRAVATFFLTQQLPLALAGLAAIEAPADQLMVPEPLVLVD